MSAIDNYHELIQERDSLRTRIQSLEATIEACRVALEKSFSQGSRMTALKIIHESQHKGVKA